MGLLLGIMAEAKSHYDKKKRAAINYCNMKQYVYMDIGYETGVPIGRIIIKLDNSINESLIELFLKLARGQYYHPGYGQKLQYTQTPIDYISSSKNLIMSGDVLHKNGTIGCAPLLAGTFEEKAEKMVTKVENQRGKVCLLASDRSPGQFSSIFYILLEGSGPTQIDGCCIGDVVEGIGYLDEIVMEYGTEHGQPKKELKIHQCGHL